MPVVRIGTKLVYFAHVPKCAGSAVEEYLAARFGPLGFLNRSHLKLPQPQRWSRTSPQHIDAKALELLFPPTFFAARFAVVRHPIDRMTSVFRYQRDIERTIPAKLGFADWLERLEERRQARPFYLDNHARAMAAIVPANARVFRLEDGTEPIVAWLDKLAENSDGPREIRRTNTYHQRIALKKKSARPAPEVTDQIRRQIADYYAADFQRFGYDMADSEV